MSIAIVIVLILVTILVFMNRVPYTILASESISNNTSIKITNNTNNINTTQNVVKAGDGNSTVSFTQFFPQKIEIKVGDSVTWYNPTRVPQPHTVTFLMGGLYPTQLLLPIGITQPSQFVPLPSTSNGQPIVIDGQNETKFIIAANARAYNPVVINSMGNATYLDWNANYTMDGSEKYINSGWLFPKGEIPPEIKAGKTFTITFKKAGLYEYTCIFHPWMTGRIIVK